MSRYCLRGQGAPQNLELDMAAHRAVWPELLRALKDSGWHNYSLFSAPDELLIGYVESDDLDEAQAKVAATEVNALWLAQMERLFASEGAPDQAWHRLVLVFNLEDQLADSGS